MRGPSHRYGQLLEDSPCQKTKRSLPVIVQTLLIMLVFLRPCIAGAAAPVIESPSEGDVLIGTADSVTYQIKHDTGKDLEIAFSHAKLKGLAPIPQPYRSIPIPTTIFNFTDTDGELKTAIRITIDDSLIGDLRLKVREKSPASAWSEPRRVRILRSAADGVATLKAWPDFSQKIMVLKGRFLFYVSNQNKTVTPVFTDSLGNTTTLPLNEYPQNVDTVNTFFVGIPFQEIPKQGTVHLFIETIDSNQVSYQLIYPDLEVVSVSGLDNLEEGDVAGPFKITITNAGDDATSVMTELKLSCHPLQSNNPSLSPACPSSLNNGLSFPVPTLASGQTQELTASQTVTGEHWKAGKYILTAKLASTYHEIQENTVNDELKQVVDVLPGGAEWQGSVKQLQIISPRQDQSISGSVVLEILQTHDNAQLPVTLIWRYLPEAAPGEWPPLPEETEIVSEVNQYRTVIPGSAFPKTGKWRISAYVKDPVSGARMTDPETNQPLEDQRDFILKSTTFALKQAPQFEQIEQDTLQPQVNNTNSVMQDTGRATAITKHQQVRQPEVTVLQFLGNPAQIITPRENQRFSAGQPVLISLRQSQVGPVEWQLQRREFSGSTFSPERTTAIRMIGGSPGSAGKAILNGVADGMYRFRCRQDGQHAGWSEWRTITIGSPKQLQQTIQPAQLRTQMRTIPPAVEQPQGPSVHTGQQRETPQPSPPTTTRPSSMQQREQQTGERATIISLPK